MLIFYGHDITLNDKKEFRSMIELIYLGNHIINSYRTNSKVLWRYEQLLQNVFSHFEPLDSKDVIFDESDLTYKLKPNIEDRLEDLIKEYDENVFWDSFIKKLVERDLTTKYGKLTEEHYKEIKELEKQYTKEIRKNGINNFELKQKHV